MSPVTLGQFSANLGVSTHLPVSTSPQGLGGGGVQFGLITPYDEHFCSHDFHGFTSPDASFGHTYPVQCSSFGTIWSAWLRFSAPHSTSDVQQFGNAFAISCGFSVAYSLFVGCTNHHGSTTSRGRGIWFHGQSSTNGHGESGQTTQVHGSEI